MEGRKHTTRQNTVGGGDAIASVNGCGAPSEVRSLRYSWTVWFLNLGTHNPPLATVRINSGCLAGRFQFVTQGRPLSVDGVRCSCKS